jgi:hypothetical protein
MRGIEMKRRGVRICVFALLGAVINVTVAWSSSLWSFWGLQYPSISQQSARQLLNRYSGLNWTQAVEGMTRVDPGATRHDVFVIDYSHGEQVTEVAEIDAGWPMRAVRCGVHRVSGSNALGSIRSTEIDGGWIVSWNRLQSLRVGVTGGHLSSEVQALPYGPIWPGFAINTVFYAAILWGLFAVPFALRRRLRVKRGLCPKCAYDLRGSDSTACPECGAKAGPS